MQFYEKANDLNDKISKILQEADSFADLIGDTLSNAEIEVDYINSLKKSSIEDKNSRNFIIELYTKIIISVFKFDEEKINEYIDFENIFSNEPRVYFGMLLSVKDLSIVIKENELNNIITKDDIKKIIRKNENINLIRNKYSNLIHKAKFLATLLYEIEDGLDVIDTLRLQNINEVGFLSKDYIYIILDGKKYFLNFLNFKENNVLINIQQKTTHRAKPAFSQQNPIIITNLKNGNRITVAGYINTPTEDTIYYNERIFNLPRITLDELKDRYNTLDDAIYQFLKVNQKGKGRYIVSGPDMGIGKTTLLTALINETPQKWGIGIIDDQNEIQAKEKFPNLNVYTLIPNPINGINECFEKILKTARDVLVVGEITTPEHTSNLIDAGTRLDSGIGATLHSFSAHEVIKNLRNLMVRSDMYNDSNVAEIDIAKCIDIVIHLKRHPTQSNRIVIDEIAEIEYIEKDNYIKPILEGTREEKIDNLLDMFQVALNNHLYKKPYKYRTIFKYNDNLDEFEPVNFPTSRYYKRMLQNKFISQKELKKFKSNFDRRKREIESLKEEGRNYDRKY